MVPITRTHGSIFAVRQTEIKIILSFSPPNLHFFLLAYKSAKCQMVKWAVASLEWIYFDTEDWNNHDQADGAYPHDAGKTPPPFITVITAAVTEL